MITLILLGLLVIGFVSLARLGLSCTPLTIAALDWWRHPMSNNLRAYLKKQVDRDFTIHYYMDGALGGETSFYLLGDGSYELWSTVTRGHERKIYSGQLPVSHVEQVVQEMLAVKIWRVRHDPSTRLDDAKVMVSVKGRGQKSIVMLWASEIRESPPFMAVQRSLLGLIRQISKGEVLENAWGTNEANDTLPSDVAPLVEQSGRLSSQFHLLASAPKRTQDQARKEPFHLTGERFTATKRDKRKMITLILALLLVIGDSAYQVCLVYLAGQR